MPVRVRTFSKSERASDNRSEARENRATHGEGGGPSGGGAHGVCDGVPHAQRVGRIRHAVDDAAVLGARNRRVQALDVGAHQLVDGAGGVGQNARAQYTRTQPWRRRTIATKRPC